MRVDKKKKLSSVTKELLTNPLQTVREVAEKTWVSKSSVASYISEDLDKLGQKDDRIVWLCETDFEIVQIWQKIIKERLQDKEEVAKMRTFEVAQTIEKSEKRYMIFKWPITNPDWWLKGLSEYTDAELISLMWEVK